VRVSFATNDERTAKRVSDALGTATEMRAMKNYAGHRLSPWLGHLMVSRSETARPLLTPGEVMQLSPADEIIMVAGTPPIRAKKVRYFEDGRFTERVLPPPEPERAGATGQDDWSTLPLPSRPVAVRAAASVERSGDDEDPTGSEKRQQPELNPPAIPEERQVSVNEFLDEFADESDDDATRAQRITQIVQGVARQVSLDPKDGIDL
jgi:type IV secretion system protein VirD4